MKRYENETVVRLIDLPPSVRGMAVLDEEGTANVYINARMSADIQKVT